MLFGLRPGGNRYRQALVRRGQWDGPSRGHCAEEAQ
jgi:hypothetical protein